MEGLGCAGEIIIGVVFDHLSERWAHRSMPACEFIVGIGEHDGSIVTSADNFILDYADIAHAVIVHPPHWTPNQCAPIQWHDLSITISNQYLATECHEGSEVRMRECSAKLKL